MAHFNTAILEVKDFNKSVVMSALKQGLRSYRLTYFFNKNFVKNYEAMLDGIQKYAHAEKEEKLSKKRKKKDKKEKKQPCEEECKNQWSSSEPPRKNLKSQSPP